jgi:hypothetical protein
MAMDYTRRDLLALMGTAGALGRYGDAAAQDAKEDAALRLAAIVERNDAAVRAALQSQITDPASPNRGSVPDQFGLHSAGSASGVVETLAASFVHPRSAFHLSAVLLEHLRIAAGFLERAQSPQGNIDLLTTNFNSPPDTGFVAHNVATAAAIGRLHGAEEIASVLRPFLVRAGAGMAEGGVHTPNHRWVICSALAQINELYPDARYARRIEEWLGEGIDIDRDGQFTERSTLTYNVVTDRALLVVAAKLKRPELLEPVRENLSSLLYLLHADGEVVTEISRRQDQFTRGNTNGYSAYVFRQALEAPYYQPLSQKVTPETWGPTRAERRQSQVCRLEQSAEVTERPNGFGVRIRAEGTAGVPLAVEICFREGGRLEGCRALRATPGSYALPAGTATYRAGANQIRFGPGYAAHEYVQLRGAEPKLPGDSVYITGFTPFDRTVVFECL